MCDIIDLEILVVALSQQEEQFAVLKRIRTIFVLFGVTVELEVRTFITELLM